MKPIQALTTYFQGVQTELRKVVWPTVPTLLQHLLSVIVGLVLFTVFVGGVDYIFIHALALLIKK